MKIAKPQTAALLHRTVRIRDRDFLSIGIMGLFDFATCGHEHLLEERELWSLVKDSIGEVAPLDSGLPKPAGEFLAYGSAYAPDNTTVAQLVVSITVGSLTKELQVLGDRTARRVGGASAPAPFHRMPIDPAHAFGGPECIDNPAGRGASPDGSGAMQEWLLHNVLPLRGDARMPAGFWAWPEAMPERTRLLGKFDQTWFAKRWPHLPLDTRDDYFHTAPRDQRIEGFWRGGEPVVIRNMHPSRPELRTSLPLLRARCFVSQHSTGDMPQVSECTASAETVWLFPDLERGIVLYRAICPINDEDADDVAQITVGWENLEADPLPAETYLDPAVEESAPATIHEPDEASETPLNVSVAAVDPEPVEENPAVAEIRRITAELEQKAKELKEKHGLSDADIAAMAPPEPAVPDDTPVVDRIKNLTAEMQRNVQTFMEEHKLTSEQIDEYDATSKVELTGQPVDPLAVADQIQKIHANLFDTLKKSGMTLENVAAHAQTPEDAKDILSLASFDHDGFKKTMASLAKLMPSEETDEATKRAAPDAPDVPRKLTRDDVLNRIASRAPFTGIDLSGLDLSDTVLDGADLSGAVLNDACFMGSSLVATDLSNCMLHNASFDNAQLSKSRLSNSSAGKASFRSALLDGAALDRGDFSGTNFSGASLADATCVHAVFSESQMHDLLATGCDASHASFTQCKLERADFTGARLQSADFNLADLTDARFTRVTAPRLNMFSVRAAGARFEDSDLRNSRAGIDSDFSGADFSRTVLDFACWLGVDIQRSVFDHSSLKRTDFSGSRAAGASFQRVTAVSANFSKADLNGANLSHSNLMRASFRRSMLDDAQFCHSNLYGAQCYGSNIGKANVTHANVDRTLIATAERPECQS